MENNLRQTFIKKGKVMFSRLASLNTVPENRLGVEILQESTQLRQYLERIQFITYESPLKIQVLAKNYTLKLPIIGELSLNMTTTPILFMITKIGNGSI